MRAFVEIRALISEDLEQIKPIFGLAKWAVDDFDEATASTFSSHRKELAAAQADYVVPFGGVTSASIAVILAYQEIHVKLGGIGQVAIPIVPKAAVGPADVLSNLQRYDQPGLFLLRGKLASIHVTNPSSTVAASFFVALVGEAV